MSDIIERLRSNAPLPICPFDKRSPEYWTTPNDKPCKFCGGEPEGPDKCTGADMRILLEAADRISALEAENGDLRSDAYLVSVIEERERLRKALEPFAKEALCWDDYSDEERIVEGFPGYRGEISVGDLRAARAVLPETRS